MRTELVSYRMGDIFSLGVCIAHFSILFVHQMVYISGKYGGCQNSGKWVVLVRSVFYFFILVLHRKDR